MKECKLEDHVNRRDAANFGSSLQQTYLALDEHVNPPNNFSDDTSNIFTGAHSSAGGVDDASDLSEINSDMVLSYINSMLMEEDMDDKIYIPQGSSALLDAEKSFSEVLSEWQMPSPDLPPHYGDGLESLDDSGEAQFRNSKEANDASRDVDNNYPLDFVEGSSFQMHTIPGDHTSQTLFSSLSSTDDSLCWSGKQNLGSERIPDLSIESLPVLQFNRGVEEANKFLPDSNKLVINVESSGLSLPQEPKGQTKLVQVKEKEEEYFSHNGTRGQKHPYIEEFDSEDRRSIKQSIVYSELTLPPEDFDKALLCNEAENCNEAVYELREALKHETNKNTENGIGKVSSGGKTKGRKQMRNEVVDLRTLLIHCAQSVAANDHRSAGELLKQIRQHSSPHGDGSQRLAHFFADGLEARLAGTGSHTYHSLMQTRTTAAGILKAFQVYMAACPFKKISQYFANRTILNVSQKAARLHIIDFGIGFGFQWPCFMQRLSARNSGPIKLIITGVDEPLPGFHPAERIDETGRRLAGYAQRFKIDFEFNSVASKFENIQVEDLKIREDEVVAICCLYQFRILADETIVVDSPRDAVLNKIRKMNPDVFIHGVLNGSYASPFFVTRFREALFHFSALFDMLECTVPREKEERSCLERELFGREALNVIACEGYERVQRPETYKQWQVRYQRAGFTQLPLNQDIVRHVKDNIKSSYNKEFIVDDDKNWLLQGWKGRILYAISTWRPTGFDFGSDGRNEKATHHFNVWR